MVDANQIVYTHKELATLLVKDRGLHSGYWGLYLKFGIGAMNIGHSPADFLPTAIVPVLEIGLQKFDKESNISVNAAEVNPAKGNKSPRKRETLRVRPRRRPLRDRNR